jgi:DNA repair exonuclease SbcCD ATPase subunit
LRQVHGEVLQTLQERNNAINSLQQELVEEKRNHREELESLRKHYEGALQERNATIHSLQSELTDVKTSCQKELLDLEGINERVLGTLEESKETIDSLQSKLDETRKLREDELASYQNELNEKKDRIDNLHDYLQRSQARQTEKDKVSQALTDETRSLKEDLKQQKQTQASQVSDIQARHASELKNLKLEHGHQRAKLEENYKRKMGNRERELQLQFDGRIKDQTEKMRRTLSERESQCNATKDSEIEKFRLRLKEATEREKQVRSKLTSTTEEGETSERELREVKKHNRYLATELKVLPIYEVTYVGSKFGRPRKKSSKRKSGSGITSVLRK